MNLPRSAFALASLLCLAAPASAQTLKFDFGSGAAPAGWTKVTPDLAYNDERGFGFEGAPSAVTTAFKASGDTAKSDGVKASAPFFFTFKVPAEGNWRVTARSAVIRRRPRSRPSAPKSAA